MDIRIIIEAVLLVIFLAIAIIMLLGKGDFMIKRHLRESQKYNIHRLRVIYAAAFIMACIILILCIWLPDKEDITVLIIVPAVIVLMVLQYTWAKRE